MAAFLTVDVLRAHAAPCLPLGTFGRAGNFAWPHRSLRRRPVLIMRWLIAPDGRLTCRFFWLMSTVDPDSIACTPSLRRLTAATHGPGCGSRADGPWSHLSRCDPRRRISPRESC